MLVLSGLDMSSYTQVHWAKMQCIAGKCVRFQEERERPTKKLRYQHHQVDREEQIRGGTGNC